MFNFIIPTVVLLGGFFGFRKLQYEMVEAGVAITGEERRRRRLQQLERSDGYKPKAYPLVTSKESFITNARGTMLFTKHWLPSNPSTIRGLVLVCHGWGDTCCYLWEDIAGQLASAGYAVFGIDYEGFGMSDGLHCHITSFDLIAMDVVAHANKIREQESWRNLPLFLYGDSMGGAVAIQVYRRAPSLFSGAVLTAPMCKVGDDAVPPAPVLSLLTVLVRFLPRWRLVAITDLVDVAFRDPVKRQYVKENPFRSPHRVRIGTGLELLRVTDEISRHMKEISLPLLVLHGAKDRLTDPQMSQVLYEHASSQDKTLKLYPESWHALTTAEPDEVSEEAIKDIISWLNDHTKGVKPGQ